MADIVKLYDIFICSNKRTREFKRGFSRLVRYMMIIHNVWSLNDFQIAVENFQRKVNLLKPNQHVRYIENMIENSIIKSPFGVVYSIPGSKEKKFLRLREVHAYSDGTLFRIRSKLQELERIDSQRPEVERMTSRDQDLLLTAINDITIKLDNRNLVRSIERRVAGRKNKPDVNEA